VMVMFFRHGQPLGGLQLRCLPWFTLALTSGAVNIAAF